MPPNSSIFCCSAISRADLPPGTTKPLGGIEFLLPKAAATLDEMPREPLRDIARLPE
jgi:hypothetical protein